jgi:hypothetical protein
VTAAAPEPEDGADGGTRGIATPWVLRRVKWLAAAWGLAAAVAFLAAGAPRRAVVLTLSAAVSIVALRSLEGVVNRLRVAEDGSAPGGLGVGYVLRLPLLVVLVLLLARAGSDPLALVLGLSAVPLALIGEALLQLAVVVRGERPRREP